ncbi:MAG: dipeptide ABC transporter ATP-binding protein [Bdellovibrionota bacterium]
MAFLEVKNLDKSFPIKGGVFQRTVSSVKAVSGVSFSLNKGETLGIVGESGCGKTTLGRTLVRLYEPSAGDIQFDGKDLVKASKSALKEIRKDFQMIFQDPFASLNPRMSVRAIIEEPLKLNKIGDQQERQEKIDKIIKLVGLRPDALNRYPHEFSGGQRQRIGIARSLILNPKLIIADEPVSALDVSIQSQILNLLVELQKKLGLTYIFITHDLAVVKYISDKIAIMYLGKIVEFGSVDDIFNKTKHPYTKALLASILVPDPAKRGHSEALGGDVPSPANPPSGCVFHTRCKFAMEVCKNKIPEMKSVAGSNSHQSACFLND